MIAKYVFVLLIAGLVTYEQIVLRQMRKRGFAERAFLRTQGAVLAEITVRARRGNALSQLHHAALFGIGMWIAFGFVSFFFFGK